MSHTTDFIVRTKDHFVADLDNGRVRIGMINFASVDFPAHHTEYNVVKNLTADEIEAAFDAYYIARLPTATNGY